MLGRMWEVNPRAYTQLAPYGKTVGIPFLLLGITLAFSGVGWLKRRAWGWRLAVVIIVTQVLANFLTALMGGVTKGLVGAIISGALLFYLLRPAVRATFSSSDEPRSFTNSSR
jgi:Na+-translocating ferredoxin:NAD+ oxidoreductase RnfD subunit